MLSIFFSRLDIGPSCLHGHLWVCTGGLLNNFVQQMTLHTVPFVGPSHQVPEGDTAK